MTKYKWLNLQLFAGEGAGASGGEGGGEGSATGSNPADAGQGAAEARLRELGVPESKIRKRSKSAVTPVQAQPVVEEQPRQDDAATGEQPQTAPRMTWDEFMAIPENSQQMQSVVQNRLRTAKAAEENLNKLTPALKALAQKYNMDGENIDYDALGRAIEDEGRKERVDELALKLGVDRDTADRVERGEAFAREREAAHRQGIEQQRVQQHMAQLNRQADAMRQKYPDFDLVRELQNDSFARMVAPGVNVPLETAYFAIHHNELQQRAVAYAAQSAQVQVANTVKAGMARPTEAGSAAQSPSAATFDYSRASKAERDALKAQIKAAASRGKKLYPDGSVR